MSLGGDRVVHGKRKNAVVLAHPGRDSKTKTNAASNATPKLSFVHRKSLFHVMLLRACERGHCGVGVVSPATRQARTSKANINCEPTRPVQAPSPTHDNPATTTRQRPDKQDVCLRGSHRFRDHRKSERKYPITTRRAISTRPGQHVFPLSSAQAHDPNTIRHEESQRCAQARV